MKHLLFPFALIAGSFASAQITFQNELMKSFGYAVEVYSSTEGKTVDHLSERTHLSIQLMLPFDPDERKVFTFYNGEEITDVYEAKYNLQNELILSHEGIGFVQASGHPISKKNSLWLVNRALRSHLMTCTRIAPLIATACL